MNQREIKFRAWDKIGTYMTDPFTLGEALRQRPMQDETKNRIYLQYTGLKDKNGKEIYESDVITDEKREFEVVFENGCFIVNPVRGIDTRSSDWFSLGSIEFQDREWEVIGNIYENKELTN